MAGNIRPARFLTMMIPMIHGAGRFWKTARASASRGQEPAAPVPAPRSSVRLAGTVTLAVILLFMSTLTPVIHVHGAQALEVVPVILASEGPGGEEYWAKTGVLEMLSKNGWCEGENLWIFQPEAAFGDLPCISSEFAAFVRETTRAKGIDEIQVVAPGVAGLYVRYCVEAGLLYPVKVKTLVTVASPHRGAFFAGVIKSVLAMIRYEREVSKDTGLLDVIAGKAPPIDEFGLDEILAHTPWESESQFIFERARCYERLYHEYLMERHFAVPGLPLESSQETFPGWLSRRYPEIWETKIAGRTFTDEACAGESGRAALDPASGDGVSGPGAHEQLKPQISPVSPGGRPEPGTRGELAPPTAPGTGLTLAYYELLAMEAAKNGYAMKIVPRESLLESITGDPYIPPTWEDALVHYGLKILAFVAKNLVILGKGLVEEQVLSWGLERLGFLDGPDDPFLGRLVTESVVVNMGRSGRNRFFAVPANAYLAGWNRSSLSSRNGTRYVSMVEKRPDVLRGVWPQLGPSDWFVQVDAAVAPAGPDDVVMVFNTLGPIPGRGLLGNKLARDALLNTLKDPYCNCPVVRPRAGRTARVEVSSWRPSVVFPAGEAGADNDEYEIRVAFGSVPAGWQLVAAPAGGFGDLLFAAGLEDAGKGRVSEVVSVPCAQADTWTTGLAPLSSVATAAESLNGSTGSTAPGGGVFIFRVRAKSGKSPLEAGVVLKLVPEHRTLAGPMSSVPELYTREVSVNVVVEVKPEEEATGTEWPETGSVVGEGSSPGKGVRAGGEQPEAPDLAETEKSGEKATRPGGTGSSDASLGTPRDSTGDGLPDNESPEKQLQGNDGVPSFPSKEGEELPAESSEQATPEGNLDELAGWGPLIVVTYRSKKTAHWAPEENYRVPFSLELLGPSKWVTGKPAKFEASFRVETPPGVTLESVSFDPAPKFTVVWKRAGDFKVGVAVKAKFRITLGSDEVRATNVYYTEVPVSVLTFGITE